MGEWEWAHVIVGGVATAIFLFQTFGTVDHDSDYGMDHDAGASHSGFSGHTISDYLSVRNLVALFVGYGWVTLAASLSGASRVAASLAGLCAGIVLVFISLSLLRTFLGLQENGTLDLESLTGKRASVYIAIGGASSSAGKVMVDTKTGRVELPARTSDAEALRPGQSVKILRTDGGTLWVTADRE